MDWSPQTNYHKTHCEALDTPSLASVWRHWTDWRMSALVFVYIIEVVAQAHAQITPLEWFSSTHGLGIVLRMLVAYPVIRDRMFILATVEALTVFLCLTIQTPNKHTPTPFLKHFGCYFLPFWNSPVNINVSLPFEVGPSKTIYWSYFHCYRLYIECIF